uniref:Uncharacterized protein n=1 Tax=Rhizophagus irregularis (strain DAOM 181602 / DAOM 197198 / MUCL 43194) TaxID=747089 RepID=U9SV51_RHIID
MILFGIQRFWMEPIDDLVWNSEVPDGTYQRYWNSEVLDGTYQRFWNSEASDFIFFEGPEHQSKAPDLFSKNITRLNFEGKGSQKTNNELPYKDFRIEDKKKPKQVLDFHIEVKKAERQVKEAETSSGLPYQSKGS